ncbi:hypothetical protein [Erwinia sp. CGal63]|uniref:hypothetical protein n=1 Tax=Erwinia sp. CGal63 TaxID=2919889 RepID=UPI003008A04C
MQARVPIESQSGWLVGISLIGRRGGHKNCAQRAKVPCCGFARTEAGAGNNKDFARFA